MGLTNFAFWVHLAIALLVIGTSQCNAHRETRRKLAESIGDKWHKGRATWYTHPWTGSCGYGRLNSSLFDFSYNAVAAMADTMHEYPNSCGRCFELKCRPAEINSADGQVKHLDRTNACLDQNKSIVIQVVDTCPCSDNKAWCCGDTPHFDLGEYTFRKLAENVQGVIGLSWRAVPCSAKNGTFTEDDTKKLEDALNKGASTDIFVNGDVGVGWVKTIYGESIGDVNYNSSLVRFDDGAVALCQEYHKYGGLSFTAGYQEDEGTSAKISTFAKSKGLEFWALNQTTTPNMLIRAMNVKYGPCEKEPRLREGDTGIVVGQWRKYFFPIESFNCTEKVKPKNIDRIVWESRSDKNVSLCIKDVTSEAPLTGALRATLAAHWRSMTFSKRAAHVVALLVICSFI